MGFVFSPSNLSTFCQCPRKFQGQSMTKEIPYKPSKARSRGVLVHNTLEQAIRKGFDTVKSWPEGVDMDFIRQRLNLLERVRLATECKVFIEQELCINKKGEQVDWWADDAWLRAKADMLIVPTNPSLSVSLVDFKTGKRWDDDHMQLRLESYLAHTIFKRPRVRYSYWYVDAGELDGDNIDMSGGLYPVQDLLNLIDECQQSINANYFPPQKNRFCKWCGFYQTTACGL